MSSTSYYARRYRTLFNPDALDFSPRPPRPATAAIYSPAPSGIYCGLPKVARVRGPGIAPLLIPIFVATGVVAYLESRLDRQGLGDGVKEA